MKLRWIGYMSDIKSIRSGILRYSLIMLDYKI